MKWKVRLLTKRKRKYALRVKAKSIEDLVDKLARHAGNLTDIIIETPVSDPVYWKSRILNRLFAKTRKDKKSPTLFE
jgi:hypothetical protein